MHCSSRDGDAPERVVYSDEAPQRVPVRDDEGLQPFVYQTPSNTSGTYKNDEYSNQVHVRHADQTGKSVHSPLRIAGLRPKAFWLTFIAIGLVIVGAPVGGAVGVNLTGKAASSAPSSSPSATSSSVTVVTTTVAALSTSTTGATTDCPNSNATNYTPGNANGNGNGEYQFEKYCGYDVDGSNLAQAMAQTFDECVLMCSNWNYIWVPQGGPRCTGVCYQPGWDEPGNCFSKNSTSVYASAEANAALLLS